MLQFQNNFSNFKKGQGLKIILANLQANYTQGAMAQRGVVCEKQTQRAWLGGTQQATRRGRIIWQTYRSGEGCSLSLSLSLVGVL